MKKSIIKSAKTKDAAIELALDEIGKSKDEVEIEILEEESSGFLGLIGNKDAVVRVSYEEDIKEALSNLEREIESTKSFGTENEDFEADKDIEAPEEIVEIKEDEKETLKTDIEEKDQEIEVIEEKKK
ncbi:Jag N-terminal domain-containing protein [Anaerococcus prevotii]|uniref:RNA-binding protein KhpB N-terminal domain-containing protein n=1 Tax=Anaerococcus prevotii ACS-065-V-Col13 TaxID=879305 RepID=F0GW39_9FIRM|nr:Jag N-terminal domain-containing protein [Anaerococcus prevotii]EGC81942.1 hypothetical protein HMPREF9290_0407 [Anaerococcus prevotii ACS-065-V-Col13]